MKKLAILIVLPLITFAYGESNSESCDKTWSEVCHLSVKVLEIYPNKNNEPSIKNLSDKEWIERVNKLGTRDYTCEWNISAKEVEAYLKKGVYESTGDNSDRYCDFGKCEYNGLLKINDKIYDFTIKSNGVVIIKGADETRYFNCGAPLKNDNDEIDMQSRCIGFETAEIDCGV